METSLHNQSARLDLNSLKNVDILIAANDHQPPKSLSTVDCQPMDTQTVRTPESQHTPLSPSSPYITTQNNISNITSPYTITQSHEQKFDISHYADSERSTLSSSDLNAEVADHAILTQNDPIGIDGTLNVPRQPFLDDIESLSTIALRSFGEVLMFQSNDLSMTNYSSRNALSEPIVPLTTDMRSGSMPKGITLTNHPFSSPILKHAPTDSKGFVYLDDLDIGMLSTDYDEIDDATKLLVDGYCRSLYINVRDAQVLELVSQYLFDQTVLFDISGRISSFEVNVSSNGFRYGVHEWNIKVLTSDPMMQQIGVIGSCDFEALHITGSKPPYFDHMAQSLFTHCGNKVFYASYNSAGKSRCVKDLSKKYRGWQSGDVITVRLVLGRHPKVTYLLNGSRVRKVMSLARHETYYPVIVCGGHGVYELIDFQ